MNGIEIFQVIFIVAIFAVGVVGFLIAATKKD